MSRKQQQFDGFLPGKYGSILRIFAFRRIEGAIPPSIRDLMTLAEVSSSSVVNYYLHRLMDEGYLAHEPRVSRGWSITEQGMQAIGYHLNLCPTCGQPVPMQKRRQIYSGGEIAVRLPVPA